MSFLSPWSALVAAAATVPLLLLLYFLKLRRQRIRIASTLLWRQAFEDLAANAPFQRLRWSVLLLLQLLILLALVAAMGEPMIRGSGGSASRVVLLVDRSASMNAVVDGEGAARAPLAQPVGAGAPPAKLPRTRLDEAKDAATAIIERLGERGQPSQMMVIAFGLSAQVISPFEANKDALVEAVNAISPTDEQAHLSAALDLAGAFAGTSEETDEQPPLVVLLSDGGVEERGDQSSHVLKAGAFEFIEVGVGAEQEQGGRGAGFNNVGIASMAARRDYEDPSQTLIFARLVNAGPEPVEAVATLTVDGEPVKAIRRTIPPAKDEGLGEQTISEAIRIGAGAVLGIRHNHVDQLGADDAAAVVLPAPLRPRVCVVYPGGSEPESRLRELLTAMEPASLQFMTEPAYQSVEWQRIDSGEVCDLIVFDRVNASRLPAIGSLTIGGAPAGVRTRTSTSESEQGARPQGKQILSWERQHPLMREVSLDTVVYTGAAYELPAGATALALGSDGPAIAAMRERGAQHVMVAFDLRHSNWHLHVGSVVFIQNVIDAAALGGSGQNGLVSRPGEAVTVRANNEARELVVDGPTSSTIAVEPGGMVSFPIRRAGLYRVRGAVAPHDQLAVSMLSDVESDIRPRPRLKVSAETSEARQASSLTGKPLWPWLVAGALGLLVVEWIAYCWRVRGW
ncbi:MAG: VWA domain-containing protein [Phycisphaerales bacterium]|nr:VWA domain-containing protein [Phycisphaerales bacterium]MCI0631824.1 VWA domain-containing protein [Phycisphaerales bacterium]MCI0675821.1 VWA domain-containing protein [Phycisphaerales bacterium]